MRENCECNYCKHKIDLYFCISCGYNFNECESAQRSDGLYVCPKCLPEFCQPHDTIGQNKENT